MHRSLRALLLPFLLGCTLLACDQAEVEDPTLSLSFDQSAYVPMEVALVSVTGAEVVVGRTYPGTFGGQDVSLTPADDSTLVVLVPDLTPGPHTIVLDLDGTTAEGETTVSAPPSIPDPDAFVAERLTALDTRLDALAAYVGTLGLPPDLVANDMARLRALAADAHDAFDAASDAERLAIARFMAANPDVFEFQPTDGETARGGESPEERLERLFSNVRRRNAGLIIAAVGVWTSVGTPAFPFALAGALYYIYQYNSYLIDHTAESISLVGLLRLDEDAAARSGGLTFVSDQPRTFSLSASYRSLGAEDLTSTSPMIRTIVQAALRFKSTWDRLMAFTLLETTPYDVATATSTQTIETVSAAYVTPRLNGSPAGVTMSYQRDGTRLALTFTADQEREVSFILAYVYPNGASSETTLMATVTLNGLFGMWVFDYGGGDEEHVFMEADRLTLWEDGGASCYDRYTWTVLDLDEDSFTLYDPSDSDTDHFGYTLVGNLWTIWQVEAPEETSTATRSARTPGSFPICTSRSSGPPRSLLGGR